MTAIHNLYLKWRAFRELADVADPDNWIGNHIFKTEDGAQRFSKLLRGDLGCSPIIAQDPDPVHERVDRRGTFARAGRGIGASRRDRAADLELPVLTFAARLHQALGAAAEEPRPRPSRAVARHDPAARAGRGQPVLVVERHAAGRSFASAMPSRATGRSSSKPASIRASWRSSRPPARRPRPIPCSPATRRPSASGCGS